MTDVVRNAIAEELAALERVTSTPTAPFGFGTDLRNDGDLREDMAEVDPFSAVALGEALVRRLDCPRGALPDDGDYGLDVRAYCNQGTTADEIRSLSGRISAELTKDDRVDTVIVTVTPSPTGSSLGVAIRVRPVDPRIGEFDMTLAVTSAEVLVEELRTR